MEHSPDLEGSLLLLGGALRKVSQERGQRGGNCSDLNKGLLAAGVMGSGGSRRWGWLYFGWTACGARSAEENQGWLCSFRCADHRKEGMSGPKVGNLTAEEPAWGQRSGSPLDVLSLGCLLEGQVPPLSQKLNMLQVRGSGLRAGLEM